MEKLKEILAKKTLDESDIAFINANRSLLTKKDLARLGYDQEEEKESKKSTK